MLWRIEGFSSDDPIPDALDAPTPTDMSKQTRSYFTPTVSPSRPAMFTRLAQFATPDCGIQFFMRFRVFHAPGKHPILAFANAKSRTMFWDFARFNSYAKYMADLKEAQKAGRLPRHEGGGNNSNGAGAGAPAAVQKPSWLTVKKSKKPVATAPAASVGMDKESMVSASPDPESVTGLGYSQRTLQEWAEMYDLSNPVRSIKAHRSLQIDGGFVGRQVGWSPEGEWCVVVGNGNRALIYHRWGKEKGVATPAT